MFGRISAVRSQLACIESRSLNLLCKLPSRSIRPNHVPFKRSYATHKDLPFRASPYVNPYNSPTASSWKVLLRPLTVTLLFTGSSFALAYYLDNKVFTSSPLKPDQETKLKILTGLIAANVAVFACFYIAPTGPLGRIIYRVISRYSTLDARYVHRFPLSVLTSGFSHTEIWHLALNMMGLYTVGSAVYDLFGTNQFLAFYGSAICWSGMAQLAATVYGAKRGVLPRPSLGASGGIYALFGAVAWYVPGAKVFLLFLPFVPIHLGLAFTGMMAMDLFGLCRGWTTFGHAAHFGGGMIGLLYGVGQVPEVWIDKRRASMRKYLNRWGR